MTAPLTTGKGTWDSPVVIYERDGDIGDQVMDYVDHHPDHEGDLHFLIIEETDEKTDEELEADSNHPAADR